MADSEERREEEGEEKTGSEEQNEGAGSDCATLIRTGVSTCVCLQEE